MGDMASKVFEGASSASTALSRPTIRVEQGLVQGVLCENEEGKYWSFKGIPYAKPPIGDRRFRNPVPVDCWEGIYPAYEHKDICPQYNDRKRKIDPGNEDCLYLNVYTPDLNPKAPLAVMVWIHGGGFYTGSGNSDFYGPEFFVQDNVILVTFNYRLEVLGFLCLDLEEAPGNVGLKDQALALKWVKKNIENFGGDANNITIFGNSAGAGAVSYHLISEMSKGLFHKAICQSGVCLNEWAYNLYPRQRAIQLGNQLGANTEDPEELLKFLKSVPALQLFNIKLPPLDVPNYDVSDEIVFGPVVEKTCVSKDPFITEKMSVVVKEGHYIADVPIIIGYASGDGLELAKYFTKSIELPKDLHLLIPRELKLNLPYAKWMDIGEKMSKIYFRNRKDVKRQELVDLLTDTFFLNNIRRFAKWAAQKNRSPVYTYCFNADTGRGIMKARYKMESLKGVCHADELPYQFHVTCFDLPLSKQSRAVITRFVRLWTDFAKTGNPTPTDEGVKWRSFSPPTMENCYVIDKKCTNRAYLQKHGKFWDAVFEDQLLDVDLPLTTCNVA